jgi:hypothetical protein
MININELTIGEVKELAKIAQSLNLCSKPAPENNSHPYQVGDKYFVRTVTHHYTGQLEQVSEHELVLSQAAWVADDGKFSAAVSSGNFNEVEMYPACQKVIIGRAAILDAVMIPVLPTQTK